MLFPLDHRILRLKVKKEPDGFFLSFRSKNEQEMLHMKYGCAAASAVCREEIIA